MRKQPHLLIFLFLLGFSGVGYGQNFCPNVVAQGNIVSLNIKCAPNATKIWEVRFTFDNAVLSDISWDPNNVAIRIDWGDGSPVINYNILSASADIVSYSVSTNAFGTTFNLQIQHTYSTFNADCLYESTAQLRAPGTCIGVLESREWEVWGTDEENGATLALNPSVPNGEVCVGTDFNITIADASTWNCIDPGLVLPNDETRWVRFIYGNTGTGDANRIPNVFVGGVQVTNSDGSFTLGAPLTGAVVEITGPGLTGPTEISEIISMSSIDEEVGDRFTITLQNWNECNQYDDGIGVPPINGDNIPIATSQDILIIGPVDPIITNNEYCQGDPPTSLTVTNFPGVPTTVSWYTTLTGPGPIGFGPSFIPPTAGIYYAEFTEGCISKNRTVAVLTENPLPTDVSVIVNKPNICFNDNVSISIPVSEAGINYQLRNDVGNVPIGGVVAGTGFNLTMFTGTLTSTSSFNVLATNATSSCDLELSDIITVSVNPTINASASVDDPTVCIGESIVLNATITGGSGSYSYLWTGPNGFSSTSEDPIISGASALATGNYSYTVTDIGFNPTTGVCNEISNTVNVTMLAPPSAADISGDATICLGDNATLLISVIGGSGTFDITIDNGLGLIPSWTGPGDNPSVSPGSTTTYLITNVVDVITGCNVGLITGSATITISNPTDADLDTDNTICLGDATDLVVNIIDPVPTANYHVEIEEDDGTPATLVFDPYINGSSISVSPTVNTTYTLLLVRDMNGCDLFSFSDDTAVITVGSIPTSAMLNVGDVCFGADRVFSIDIVGGATPYDIDYTINGTGLLNDPAYASGNVINLGIGAVSTNYTIDITRITDACGVNILALPTPDDIFVNALPTATPQTLTVCSDNALGNTATVDLTSPALEALINGGAVNYTWYTGNSPLSGAIGNPTSYVVTDGVSIFAEVDDATCTDIATITYTVNPRPDSPVSNGDILVCFDVIATSTVSATVAGGSTIDWYDVATLGTPLTGGTGTTTFDPSTIDEPTPGSTKTFYAESRIIATGCTGTSRTPVTLTSDARPDDPMVTFVANTCSDASILTGNVATNGGTGTWTLGNVLYYETFSSADNGVGATGGLATTTPSSGNWTLNVSNGVLVDDNDHIRVQGGQMVAQDTDNDGGAEYVEWISKVIDISAFPGGVDFSVDVSSTGVVGDDGIEFFYRLNGGGPIPYNSSLPVPIALQTVTETGVIGNDIQIIIRIELAGNGQFIQLDNVIVKPTSVAGVPIIADVNNPTSAVTNLQDGVNTFTWSINSALGACTLIPAILNITKNPQPTTANIDFGLCETNIGGGTSNDHDLDDHNAAISNGLPNRTVSWYMDANFTMPVVPSSNIVNISDLDIYYAKVVDDLTFCNNETPVLNVGSVTFNVSSLPNASAQVYAICEELGGSANKDDNNLPILFNDLVTGIVGSVDRTVTWYFDPGVPVSGPSDLSIGDLIPGGAADVDGVSDGTIFYAVVTDTDVTLGTNCQNVASIVYDILPRAPIRGIVGPSEVCAESSFISYSLPATIPPSTYNWSIPVNPGFIEIDLGGGLNDRGVTLSFPALTASPNTDTYVISVTETLANGCVGDPNFFTIDVLSSLNPMGVSVSEPPVCSDTPFTIDPQNSTVLSSSSTFTWTAIYNGLTVGGASPPASGNGVINASLTNNTNIARDAIYTVIPTIGTCVGNPFDITISILPEPVMDPTLATPLSVCSDNPNLVFPSTINVVLNTSGTSTAADSYIVSVKSLDVNLIPVVSSAPLSPSTVVFPAVAGMSSGIENDRYANKTSTPLMVVYTVIPVAGTCQGNPFDITVTINPEPVISTLLDNTICSKDVSAITLATNGVSVNASNYNLISVSIPGSITPQPGNAIFPQNGINASYIKFDKYENLTNTSLFVDYEFVPVSASGCLGDPEIIRLEVLPEPVLDPALSPTPVCSGLISGVTLSEQIGSVVANTYNINGISIPGGLTAGAGNAIIGDGQAADAIFNDSYINTTNVALQVTYTITPVTAAGCEGVAQTVILKINPSPALKKLDDIVCSDSKTGIILIASPSSIGAASFEIVDIRPDISLLPDGSNAIPTTTVNNAYLNGDRFTNPTNGVLYVEYDIIPISGTGCRGPQATTVISIEPEIKADDPADQNICSGDATSILLSSPTIPSTGNVTLDVSATASSPLVSGFTAFAQNKSNGSSITDILVNNSDDAQTVTYQITPRAFGANNGASCSGSTPTEVVVTILPVPKVSASSSFVTICEDQNLAINLTSSTNPAIGTLQFEITNVTGTGGVTGFSSIGTLFTSIDQINDNFNNPTTSNQTVNYTITPRAIGTVAGNCVGNPISIVITVIPKPSVTPSLADVRICSGEIVNVSLPTDVANSIAAWTVSSNTNVIGQFDGLGTSLFQSLINTSSEQQILTYSVEPFLLLDNTCRGSIELITVTIDPVPDVAVNDSQISICSGETLNIELNGNSLNTTYEVVATSSNADISGYTDFTATNGDFLNQTIVHTGTTPETILYTITPFINQPAPDVDPCKGLPQVIIVTVSPPIGAQILTDNETLCVGNTKAIEFELKGSAPFKLTLEKTDANGIVTQEIIENLASRHVILATESVSYRIIELEDLYNCIINPTDEVSILFEEALADFTINGSKTPAAVTLDFNTGTVAVGIVINNYSPANTYTLQIGDDTFTPTGSSFTYTFTEPSTFGTLGFVAELQVQSPTASINCSDVKNFFIEVIPASPTVAGFADVLEGCPPLTVNFESFRDDLSLSRNVVIENLEWDIDGTILRTPNPTFTFTKRGVYNVQIKGDNGYGQEELDNVVITVFDQPNAEFTITQSVVYIPDDGFRPTNRSQRATEFLWDFGDFNTSTSRSPEHFYELEGEYEVSLKVTNDFGCTDTFVDTVFVEEGGFTKTPNAFTPSLNGPSGGAEFDPRVPGSGDAANDIFLPITQGVEDFKMFVYDRWGNLIFYSDNKRVGWDGYNSKGHLLPAGVYVYKLELILSDGQRTQRIGDITLIR